MVAHEIGVIVLFKTFSGIVHIHRGGGNSENTGIPHLINFIEIFGILTLQASRAGPNRYDPFRAIKS